MVFFFFCLKDLVGRGCYGFFDLVFEFVLLIVVLFLWGVFFWCFIWVCWIKLEQSFVKYLGLSFILVVWGFCWDIYLVGFMLVFMI